MKDLWRTLKGNSVNIPNIIGFCDDSSIGEVIERVGTIKNSANYAVCNE